MTLLLNSLSGLVWTCERRKLMKVLCFGSLNMDMVFTVPHFVRAGETLSSSSMKKSPGGKGANQAAALAKAGCRTYMAGKIGEDGRFITSALQGYGADVSNVIISDCPTGQAIIQLSDEGQNAIILLAGGNKEIREEEADAVLDQFVEGDWIVLQNEICLVGYIMRKAHEKGMRVCINPAPFDESVRSLPLEMADLIVVNEIEGAGLAGISGTFEDVIRRISSLYPEQDVIMTVGPEGAYYSGKAGFIHQSAIDYPVADTTAAGDTFIGYYLASVSAGLDVREALYYASKASGIAVSRLGAMESIPDREEVFSF